ncbi:acyl-ACP--UDP-N-acetylglucosamine O-acyltransferase [Aetokthonos hydrillicola Thurmond2011]|uniref:Acyl-[acyl-carrier-protein]--UDP-N-acetylglucosamine O-acyltransferase n=1 Tax=Aetokthonos hydrillicola Thurmond2011 TaxID=2712845 RepID=A0AAP5IA46_9CYAN|nr:acyl-ACP--UDP-N-acetylglucosamine O-acyltransferase [Aetokthonos hydrillicola]MBO3460538.1 acyl-ACP--UDP-N-acetylglucosamine O-acyltransferase [Aetokthonos hydrillicola CCALA 1050]MBW4585334.1 acyl-ACP--UDP-N-acetylglucosamine O-acyltransferase [Aetokthonos hydrillicola CCALA 1050]MDR9896529.1 acyl-ACP--UDP-N-acetylglucosamine O-acyltransferase [Aetokthonos hydrillicola Thurmond2011]
MKTLIHPTAVIHPNAELHPTVQVGAYAVIGGQVKVGPETVIGAHVVLEGPLEIGMRNQIFPGAAIGMEPQDLKFVGERSWVKIGDDNLIREYVTINRATGAGEATTIGNGNLLMAYAHVAHNCVIEDFVVIPNSVALAGHVYIESRARLGGVLGVHQFVHIGRMSMVGGMARIDRDVPPYMLVEGNPARVRSLNLVGLKRSGLDPVDLQILKKAFRILYRSDLTFKEALEELETLGDTEELQNLRRFLLLSQMPGRRGCIPGKGKKALVNDD